MKKSIKKISFLICGVAFLTATVNIVSINTAQAKELEQIESRGFEPEYYFITGSWCCYEGHTGCIPLNC